MSDRHRQTGQTTDTVYLQQLEERIRAREHRVVTDLAAVLSTPEGRRTLRRILVNANIYASLLVDAPWIYFQVGRRELGLELLAELAAHTNLYLLMEAEARELADQEAAEDAAYAQYLERVKLAEEEDR